MDDGQPWLDIVEAHYDDTNPEPHSWTRHAMSPGGETIEELRNELHLMLAALDKPVIVESEAEQCN